MLLALVLLLISAALLIALYNKFVRRENKRKVIIPAENSENLFFLGLQPKISWCKYLENVGDKGECLARQYSTIKNLYDSSLALLKQKFNVGELTFSRYQKTIDDAKLLLTDNVSKLIPLLETLDEISDNESVKKQTLQDNIDKLLKMNDDLIEKLNELIVNLSAIKNLQGPDEKTSEFLLENLKTLIERAKLY